MAKDSDTFKKVFEVISKRLKDKGLKATNMKVAELAGVSEGAVRSWRNGREPGIDAIISIAKSLNVSLDTLIDQQDVTHNLANEPAIAYAGQRGKYATAEAMEADWNYVKRTIQENHSIKIFRVLGNSMAPTLWDTDLVFCYDNGDLPIANTYIYVIDSVHHGLLIKRVRDRDDGTIVVYGDNRDIAKSFPLNLHNEVNGLWRVRCKVTWQLGELKMSQTLADTEQRLEIIEKRIELLKNRIS